MPNVELLMNLKQLIEVKALVRLVHEGREVYGSQVANGHLVRRGELHNLGTQVGRLDGAQVLLVGLAIASILLNKRAYEDQPSLSDSDSEVRFSTLKSMYGVPVSTWEERMANHNSCAGTVRRNFFSCSYCS